ncbi:MAG: UDP-diphosphatase [Actinobacteria bacterium]|nr:UDP-diphosphatase [Actinomycetota bacterium]
MGILPALLLGVVQGFTEFWPISSSAHLALLIHIFGWGEPELSFLVALHLGTWVAVTWFYRRRLASILRACWRELRGAEKGEPQARLGWMLLLATLPGLIVGAVFSESSEMMEGMPLLMVCLLAAFGLALWASDELAPEAAGLEEMGWREALSVGLAQALALAPGVSRSGASVTVARAAGLRREDAADFAFLLSVPIIGAAAAFEGVKLALGGMTADQLWPVLAGGAAAAVSGYLAVGFLLSRIKKGTFRPYAVYRLLLAVFLMAIFLWF